MFVSHAKVRIVGLGGRSRKRRPHRRRLAVKEVVRMPCLLPTTVIVFLGLIAVAGGAGMSVIGYIPNQESPNNTDFSAANMTLAEQKIHYDKRQYALRTCSYVGPVVMAIGMFAMITASVFYCEILDKYAILVPDKKAAVFDKEELYQVIVGEMKKSYAQTLITAYSKAAERRLLIDHPSSSGDYLPEPIFPHKVNEPLTIEQQIDIECEGYTPSPPIPNKRYSVIQARIQRLRSEDNWLKTSSLPNIRRSVSIKRAGRVGAKIRDSRTLSYDYTMDEARLRRKSMMLRSLVQWNSESSDMIAQKQRRFSSVKALPSQRRASLDEMLCCGYGSFPLTRLIQRRGTFACGDMRTRRMKFLLLLEASESQEGFHDSVSMDGRATVAGIRRNSFIPYATCDKFIAGEEKKTSHDRRRSSVNPFSFGHRFGNTIPQPGGRRHSFYPIRREDRIYTGDPNEQRRHSFNPIGVNNTFKPEFAANPDGRRASFNPDGLPDRTGERRASHIPATKSRFLQVPGFEHDPYIESRPSSSSEDIPEKPDHVVSDSSFNYFKSGSNQPSSQSSQDERRVERRHSFNPLVRVSATSGGGTEEVSQNLKIPKITINAETPPLTGRFLAVPSQDFYNEERERRHSLNTTTTTKTPSSTVVGPGKQLLDKPSPQRISFKLEPDTSLGHSSPPLSQTTTKSTLKTSKPTSDPVRPSSFKQEMVIFKPLMRPDSRSVSPNSNASCCGSERIGSERSLATSRTASISSDRSAKTILTISPVSIIAADGVLSYGTFKPSSQKSASASDKSADPKCKQQRPTQNSPAASIGAEGPAKNFEPSPRMRGLDRKSASFRDTRGRRRLRYQQVIHDSPLSTNSGPATLSPSLITDANAAIQRSKSASALPEIEITRSQSSPLHTLCYARVPKPSSPLVTRHKPQTGKQTDKKSS